MEVASRKLVVLFVAVAVLLFAQVAWWTVVFLQDVNTISRLKLEALELRVKHEKRDLGQEKEKIEKAAFRHRVMFISESTTFILLSLFGIFLLYGAFQNEARARQTERNFIEVVSHESRTPLTAMKLRLEALASKTPTSTSELRLVLEEVRRLSAIFDKAMSLSRLERDVLSFETIALSAVVRDVVSRMDPLFSSRNVACELGLDDEAHVRGDSYALSNAIQCLVENAVFYNDRDDKKVLVRLSRGGGKVILSVSDNGSGIDSRDQKHIFDRFYRGKHRKAGVSGTGLGLFLAKTLVEAHQGTLVLDSSSEKGTTFRIELSEVRA